MKLYRPGRSSLRSGVKSPKLSSHLVKPAKFASSKVSIKAPRASKSRAVKIKL